MTQKNEGQKIIDNADGSKTIGFEDRPLKIDGTEVKALTMREPSVGDQLIAKRQGGSDNAEQEIVLIANLVEQPREAIEAMTMRQYTRLQEAYSGFLD